MTHQSVAWITSHQSTSIAPPASLHPWQADLSAQTYASSLTPQTIQQHKHTPGGSLDLVCGLIDDTPDEVSTVADCIIQVIAPFQIQLVCTVILACHSHTTARSQSTHLNVCPELILKPLLLSISVVVHMPNLFVAVLDLTSISATTLQLPG